MESSDEQKEIIKDKNNLVIIARPGSGKTRLSILLCK